MQSTRGRGMIAGGVAGVLAVGILLLVEGHDEPKEPSLTVEQWHQESSGPFLRQMAAWRQLTQELGMTPVTDVHDTIADAAAD
ncbi:hypothetical protein H7347_01000 [Corynebacterium sp. zg-331]|uniref:hypothetical protein n=1 Tax=unclassified Corynebacterium TaxID=2624378 RepID=UPI00128B1229|nr:MULTISPECIES: hypothetical protein [unclassified Corynebacterium]MBC3185163.1 hypothetical protein [Corynebacterium sp. zg-331]MPV51661.1 hypothetical protein [Corynebacterium sp. zg331]